MLIEVGLCTRSDHSNNVRDGLMCVKSGGLVENSDRHPWKRLWKVSRSEQKTGEARLGSAERPDA